MSDIELIKDQTYFNSKRQKRTIEVIFTRQGATCIKYIQDSYTGYCGPKKFKKWVLT